MIPFRSEIQSSNSELTTVFVLAQECGVPTLLLWIYNNCKTGLCFEIRAWLNEIVCENYKLVECNGRMHNSQWSAVVL